MNSRATIQISLPKQGAAEFISALNFLVGLWRPPAARRNKSDAIRRAVIEAATREGWPNPRLRPANECINPITQRLFVATGAMTPCVICGKPAVDDLCFDCRNDPNAKAAYDQARMEADDAVV